MNAGAVVGFQDQRRPVPAEEAFQGMAGLLGVFGCYRQPTELHPLARSRTARM